MGIQVDDRVFQAMLVDSQVSLADGCPTGALRQANQADFCRLQILYTKDWTKWNFDLIMEIVEGPLLNPKRLEEVFRVSKFGRRLLGFFHPFNRRFADIKRTRVKPRPLTSGMC